MAASPDNGMFCSPAGLPAGTAGDHLADNDAGRDGEQTARDRPSGRRLQLVSAAPRSGPTPDGDNGAHWGRGDETQAARAKDGRAESTQRAAPQGEVEGGRGKRGVRLIAY